MAKQSKKSKKIPNPGSPKAVEMGCTCAVLDNCHGAAWFERAHGFWITEGCPLHWPVLDKSVQITGSVGGRINTRKWGSKKRDIKEDQHKKKKKWYIHEGLKRTKLRWNKKRGKQELSKKGSRDIVSWAD